jgi:hypothetical protein
MESGEQNMKFITKKERIAGLAVPLLALKKNKTAAAGSFRIWCLSAD